MKVEHYILNMILLTQTLQAVFFKIIVQLVEVLYLLQTIQFIQILQTVTSKITVQIMMAEHYFFIKIRPI
jgi:hypothetical protein